MTPTAHGPADEPDLALTAETWPIAAATLQYPDSTVDGTPMHQADASVWLDVLRDVRDAGFDHVDVFDSWLRLADLPPSRLDEFVSVTREAGLLSLSTSAVRRSVIDAEEGEANLAYSHRAIDAAAAAGMKVVSFGLHQRLTPRQQNALWFWTVQGHRDAPNDLATWRLAVERLRELGRHAEEAGLVVSLEMYEDTYLGTADSAVRLVEEIGLDSVGLNPDLGNLVRLHRPVESWQKALATVLPYTNYWHVKNYLRDEDEDRGWYSAVPAPLPFGIIDYRWALHLAVEEGFQGILCTEHYGGDGLSVAAFNRSYLRDRVLPKSASYARGTSKVRQIH